MRKKIIATVMGIGVIIGGTAFGIESGIVSADLLEKIKPNKTEEQIDAEIGMVETTVTEEQFKEYLEEFNRSDLSGLENNQEKKLAQRSFVESKQAKQKIDMKELKKEAKEQAKFEKAWVKYADQEYGIKVTPKEVDEWINQGPDKHQVDNQKNYAAALGISVKELNHAYYRDQYEKWVIWEKLKPLVASKYGVNEADYENVVVSEETPVEEMNFNNKVLSLYEKEVLSSMK